MTQPADPAALAARSARLADQWAAYDAAIADAAAQHLPGTVLPSAGSRTYAPPAVHTHQEGPVTVTVIHTADYELQVATGVLVRMAAEGDLSSRILLGSGDAPEWAASAPVKMVPPRGSRVTVVATVGFHGLDAEQIVTGA